MNIWTDLAEPLVFLAPMDGYTDRAYREVVKLVDSRVITVCEFVSADALAYDSEKSFDKIRFDKELERPYVVQLFGKNVDNFKKAVGILIEMGVDGVDINMGCPAKKVVKSEHGSALRRDLDRALKVAEAVVKVAGDTPVSVKTRLGWKDESDLIDFGKSMEGVGVAGLIIHGRTYSDAFSGIARWEGIYELKRNLKIPVIGNGDVVSGNTAREFIGNLNGVMVGRATFGNPWVMGEICHELLGELESNGEFVYDSSVDYSEFKNKVPLMLEHARRLFDYKDRHGILEYRKVLLAYVKGFANAKNYRMELVKVESFEDVEKVLDLILKDEFGKD